MPACLSCVFQLQDVVYCLARLDQTKCCRWRTLLLMFDLSPDPTRPDVRYERGGSRDFETNQPSASRSPRPPPLFRAPIVRVREFIYETCCGGGGQSHAYDIEKGTAVPAIVSR